MLTLQALMYIERHGRIGSTICNYAIGALSPSKGPHTMLNWIPLSISTVGKCAHMQVKKQPEHGEASTTKEQKCFSFQTNYD